MVFTGVEVQEEIVKDKNNNNFMATGTERTRPLHNFDFPFLKWGKQRYLRCKKVDSDGIGDTDTDRRYVDTRLESSSTITRRRDSELETRGLRVLSNPKSRIGGVVEGDGEDGIEAMREKLLFDLKAAANKMKDEILRDEVMVAADNDDVVEEKKEELPPVDMTRPWNLRKRRASCKVPNGVGDIESKRLRIEERNPNYSPLRSEGNNGIKSSLIVRGVPEMKERAKFSVSLSKKEIEEDFMAILCHRPPRRPKKRPRNVQRQIDTLFPGLWLTEVTTDTYKVPEIPESGKVIASFSGSCLVTEKILGKIGDDKNGQKTLKGRMIKSEEVSRFLISDCGDFVAVIGSIPHHPCNVCSDASVAWKH